MKVISDLIFFTVISIVLYAFISIALKDWNNKKEKREVEKDGVEVLGKITRSYARSGGTSGFINVIIDFSYLAENGQTFKGKKEIAIKDICIEKYLVGENIIIRYSRNDPSKVTHITDNPFC